MRKLLYLQLLAAIAMLSACDGLGVKWGAGGDSVGVDSVDSVGRMPMSTARFFRNDTLAELKIEVEYPTGDDNVSKNIRGALLHIVDAYLAQKETGRAFDGYPDGAEDLQGAVGYYGEKGFALLQADSKNLYDEMLKMEQERAKEEGVESEKTEVLKFIDNIRIAKIEESAAYCVFDAGRYLYTGGAHGMEAGVGSVIYLKSDGKIFDNFFKSSVVKEMQPLLKSGLIEYFSDNMDGFKAGELGDYLILDSPEIPLPADAPYPSARGLVLRYQQYEVAPYAAGRPTFTIPYDKIKPYLTEEAKRVLGL